MRCVPKVARFEADVGDLIPLEDVVLGVTAGPCEVAEPGKGNFVIPGRGRKELRLLDILVELSILPVQV